MQFFFPMMQKNKQWYFNNGDPPTCVCKFWRNWNSSKIYVISRNNWHLYMQTEKAIKQTLGRACKHTFRIRNALNLFYYLQKKEGRKKWIFTGHYYSCMSPPFWANQLSVSIGSFQVSFVDQALWKTRKIYKKLLLTRLREYWHRFTGTKFYLFSNFWKTPSKSCLREIFTGQKREKRLSLQAMTSRSCG